MDSQTKGYFLSASESSALDAGLATHEGTHAGGGPSVFGFVGMQGEHAAYFTESATYQGLHNTDRTENLWNESWLTIDKDKLSIREGSGALHSTGAPSSQGVSETRGGPMSRLGGWPTLYFFALMLGGGTCFAQNVGAPISVSLCDLYENPERYAGEMVKVRGGSVGKDLRIEELLHDSRPNQCSTYMRIIVVFPDHVEPVPGFNLVRDKALEKLQAAIIK